MKLYTERQMKEMFRMGLAHSTNEDGALEQFAHIELPSDEELGKEGLKQWGNVHSVGVVGWIDGARWMRNKIQGGNK
jgi:hypothetical protein